MAKKPKRIAKPVPLVPSEGEGSAAERSEAAREVLSDRPSAGADLSQLERILAFMEQHGLEEFEYEHAGLRVRLKKPATNYNAPAHSRGLGAMPLPEILVAGSASPASASAAAHPAREDAAEAVPSPRDAEDLHVVKSPIVGTFYECPSPGAAPLVKVGDQVTVGQVLCIIEAMKLMNEIESDAAGEIVRCYVENGQPIEYGESLFAIRSSRKK